MYKYTLNPVGKRLTSHIYYEIKCVNKRGNEITKLVGINKLKRLYNEGRIIGNIPDYIKRKLVERQDARGSDQKVENKNIKMYKIVLDAVEVIW